MPGSTGQCQHSGNGRRHFRRRRSLGQGHNQNQGASQTVHLLTDHNGNFIAPVLPVGAYRITVSVTGFKTQVFGDIALRVADRIRVQVTLDPGAVQEESLKSSLMDR